ncbi:MAG: hypothetical protein QXS68_06780 [Candidatus Methanomethylicaceae archaeon]
MDKVKLCYRYGNYAALVNGTVYLCLEEPQAKAYLYEMLGVATAPSIECESLFELMELVSAISNIPLTKVDAAFQDLEERFIPGTIEIESYSRTIPKEEPQHKFDQRSEFKPKAIEAQRFESSVTYDLIVPIEIARAINTAFNNVGHNEVMLIGDSKFENGRFLLKYVFIPTQEVTPGSTDTIDRADRLPPDKELYTEGAGLVDYYESGENIRFFNTWIHLHPGGLSTTPSQKDRNTQLERLFGSGVHSPDHQIMIIGKETFPLGEVTAELWIRPAYPIKGLDSKAYVVHKLNLHLELGSDENVIECVKKRVLTVNYLEPLYSPIQFHKEPEPSTKRKKSK